MSFLRGRVWTVRGLLLLGAALLYAPNIDHPFLFDDAVQIYENPAVIQGVPIRAYFFDRNTTSSRADYNTRIYRPLRNLGFRVLAVVGGGSGAELRPRAFGVANLALYLICIALVFAAARTMASERAALLAGALFAAAPVHVEAVLYSSAFGDLLSAALELAALIVAVRSVVGGDPDVGLPRRRYVLALTAVSLVLAGAAMAAKEMAVTGVAVLALWLAVRGALWRRRGLALVGAHGVVALAYLTLRTSILGRVGQDAVTVQTILTGLREAPWLLVNYARITLLPLGHSAAYVVPTPSLIELAVALALIVGAALVARRSNSVAVRLGLGWFTVSLLPVLHLVPLWADLADRFAFFPSAGLALAAAGAIDRASDAGHARPALAVSVVLLALYGCGSLLEARSWSSDGALWTHAAEMAPTSSLAQSNLGVVRVAEGRPEEAVVAFQRAIALGRNGADLFTRLATALAALGRLDEARDAVRRAIAQQPDSGPAYALLADVEGQLGHHDAAAGALARAELLAPEHPSTLLAKAAVAERTGRPADAAAIYVGLAARLARVARFHFLAARALHASGDFTRAAAEARACLALEPLQPQCEALLRPNPAKP